MIEAPVFPPSLLYGVAEARHEEGALKSKRAREGAE